MKSIKLILLFAVLLGTVGSYGKQTIGFLPSLDWQKQDISERIRLKVDKVLKGLVSED